MKKDFLSALILTVLLGFLVLLTYWYDDTSRRIMVMEARSQEIEIVVKDMNSRVDAIFQRRYSRTRRGHF